MEKRDKYYVKSVECYINEGEDIVFVAALSENGTDGVALRRVRKNFPNLEIIDITDVDGYIDVYDMTDAQYELCEEGAIMVDECIEDVDDLEWLI